MAAVRVHIFALGRVQGIGYRSFVERQARRLGVNGWVRNLHDGRVEAVLEGDEEAVRKLIELCRRGPPFAHVDDIVTQWSPATLEFRSFSIIK